MAKENKEKKGQAEQAPKSAEAPRHAAKETPRLKTRFLKEIAPVLMKENNLSNPMSVPHLNKIVINMGMGEATQNSKVMDVAVNELGQITGQKPVVTRAKKSIAAFKVREGQAIGAMVTLRGDRMYEFFDRLVFPEISYEKVDKQRGMNVTIVTTAASDAQARSLLKHLGMPFRQ
jgi:large subunit ribosomal protein L5